MRVWFDNENNRLNVKEIPQISFATVCDVLVDQQLSVTVAKPGSHILDVQLSTIVLIGQVM